MDGADDGERNGTVVPLARRRARRRPLARGGALILQLAGGQRTAFPQPALGGRPWRALPAKLHRVLQDRRKVGRSAWRRSVSDERLPARALLRAARRPLPF